MKKAQHPLKTWMLAHPKVTQKSLAESVEASQPHLNGVANGKTGLSWPLARRIAKRTGIALADIVAASAVAAKRARRRRMAKARDKKGTPS